MVCIYFRVQIFSCWSTVMVVTLNQAPLEMLLLFYALF